MGENTIGRLPTITDLGSPPPGPRGPLLGRHVQGEKPGQGTFDLARETLFHNKVGVEGGQFYSKQNNTKT